MTQPGDLRDEIRLERQVSVPDGAGGSVITWQAVLTAPAHIRPIRGGETVMAGRLASTETIVVTIRNQPALATSSQTWRLISTRSNRVFDIKSITVDDRRAFVDFLCQTGAL